jgi:putative peptidoglycan lipid II flippase
LLVPRLLPYLAKGMSSSSLALSVHLTLMLLPMILLSTLVGLVSAALNACRRFVGPALAPGIRAIVVIGVSLVGYRALAIRAVVLGLLGGELLSLLVLSLLAWRAGIKPRIAFSLPPAVKRVLVLSVPMIVGMAAIQFNPIVDRLMAVPLGEGSVSALDYADKVMMIPMTLLGSGFLVVILSHWSQMVAEGKAERLRDSVQKAITTVAFITVPLSLYLFLMRKPLVCLLFQRGAFDEMATSTTSEVLGILALGLTPNIIGLIFVRVQLVFQNTKVLMVLGLVNTIMNLVLNLLLVQLMGLPGIALSTSLAYALIALALWLSSMRNIGNVFHKSMLANLVKVGFSSIAFSLSLLLFSLFSDGSLSTPTLIVSSVVGGVIYLCVAYIQHLEEATSLLTWMGRWLRPATEVLGGDYRESQE